MTTFLHCADLHIDSPLIGLSAYPGAPAEAIRGATRLATRSMVDLAVAEAVDLVVISGDIFDGDWKDFNTGLFFRAEMTRLREAGIEVVLIHGNHDAASVITHKLALPHVHVLSHVAPETVRFEDLGIAVHGQSFATRAVHDNLAAAYPAPLDGLVNVGLLHTSLAGHPGHDSYAPCDLTQLTGAGYDYWALGHIHERAVLSTEPYVVFSGNLQGRHINEPGAKGATLVTVGDGGLSLEHRALDHVRWARVRVTASGADGETELLERAEHALGAELETCDDRLMAARIELVGTTSGYAALVTDRDRLEAELRAVATDVGFEQIWVERITWDIAPPRSAAPGDDALELALRAIDRAAESPSAMAALTEQFGALAVKLPAELRFGPGGIDPADPEVVEAMLREARAELPAYLLGADA